MLRVRVMPCLLLRRQGLVKTVRFGAAKYVGDPMNTVRIFNEKEVDELIVLDIRATPDKKDPNFELLGEMAQECFMPMAYGGGVRSVEHAKRLFGLGIEKVIINSAAWHSPALIEQLAARFGSQAVVGAIDAKRDFFGRYRPVSESARKKHPIDVATHARALEQRGVGEILITSVDRDGTFQGYDVALTERVARAVRVPVVACGGAGKLSDLGPPVHQAGASAVAAGSLFVYQGRHRAVLVNFPTRAELEGLFPAPASR
jgi:cyclase